ncbi:MAG TPA: hypothetical protein PLQ19_01600 [Aeromicrobium sp.]|nr:hypothetical protein [Aeromicrobium sp.]
MSKRLAIAAIAAVSVVSLTGCARDDAPAASNPTNSTAPTSSASSSAAAVDVVGTWRDEEADWTVHFKPDGTFVEDYQGNKGFRNGQYVVTAKTVTLEGDDGESNEGTITNGTLVFRLGTLVRQ